MVRTTSQTGLPAKQDSSQCATFHGFDTARVTKRHAGCLTGTEKAMLFADALHAPPALPFRALMYGPAARCKTEIRDQRT
jgi:hypothetical protein